VWKTSNQQVVQKAFEHVLKDQKDQLVEELKNKVIECVKDNNGNHVIQVSPRQSLVPINENDN
jgi:TRAP-type C4-dicarboxylate transport system substrate-binding protein